MGRDAARARSAAHQRGARSARSVRQTRRVRPAPTRHSGTPPGSGIAAAAIAGLVAAEVVPAIIAWLAVSLLFLIAAIRLPAASLSTLGRLATGALMLTAAAMHLTLRGGMGAADSMAWIVNAALIAGGVFLLLPKFRKGKVKGN